MKKEGQRELLVGVTLLLIHVYSTEQSAIQGMQIYPIQYAFTNNTIITHDDTHCVRYNRGVLPLTAILNTTEYFNCSHPGLLTDSNLGPEQLSPTDDTTQVYTWEPGVNRVLLTFTSPPRNISTIVVYYYRNNEDVGLPKTIFCAESADFEIWNVTTSTGIRCKSQDEIRPERSLTECMEPCRENISIVFNFYAEKLLMVIEDSKNYRLVLSEIEFYAIEDSTTTEEPTDVQLTTAGQSQTLSESTTTKDVDIPGNTAATDESTSTLDSTQEERTTEFMDGSAVSSIHVKQQIAITTLVAVASIALSLVQTIIF